MNPELAWYVARAAGLVAWGLAAASILAGLTLSGRAVSRRRVPPAWLTDLHRSLGGLAVIFTGVHMAALLVDDYVAFTLLDLLVPLAADWRPGAVAWGVAAFYLLVAVEVSSLLRRRLATAWWRRLHLLSVPLYGLGTLHFFAAGTDAGHPLATATALVVTAAFVVLAVFRVLSRPPRVRGRAGWRHAGAGPRRATASAAVEGSETGCALRAAPSRSARRPGPSTARWCG